MHIKRIFGQILLLAALLFGEAGLVLAAPSIAVVAEDTSTGRQFAQVLTSELRATGGSDVAVQYVGEGGGEGEGAASQSDLAIALGPNALQYALGKVTARKLIAVLVTRANLDAILAGSATRPPRNVHAILLDQPLERYVSLIKLALPQRSRIGVLLSPTTAGQQKALEKAVAEEGLTLSVVRLVEERGFISQLEQLLGQCDVLLALPDPGVHNRNSVQPLLLTTYRAEVPVVAYSEAYTQAGALLSLFSTPAQIARQTATTAAQLLQGKSVPYQQSPRYFTVGVNSTVARSLGLSIASGQVLGERLKQVTRGAE